MMIHRAKVRSTSAHPITKEEHARYSEQLASFQTPLIQMPAYRQLQDPDRPFVMRQKADAFSLPNVRNLFGLYEVRLLVNGQALRFIIDTGAKQSWLGSAYIERRDLPIVSEAKIIGFGVHGREELQTPIVDRLHVYADRADITLHGCISAFVEIFPGHPYDGIFGNEIFAGRRIRFVNSRNMLLLA